MEEPTKDISTTLALGIISFIYVQTYTIKTQGFREYIKEFLVPFFLMAPLHIIGKLATIVSISFRLFGNIFGGSIISKLYLNLLQKSIFLELAGIVTGLNLLVISFFGIFEAFLQAFVFTMLTLTYLALGSQHDEEEKPKEKSPCS
jgi:F-type H+-transporting ATPase subunit a